MHSCGRGGEDEGVIPNRRHLVVRNIEINERRDRYFTWCEYCCSCARALKNWVLPAWSWLSVLTYRCALKMALAFQSKKKEKSNKSGNLTMIEGNEILTHSRIASDWVSVVGATWVGRQIGRWGMFGLDVELKISSTRWADCFIDFDLAGFLVFGPRCMQRGVGTSFLQQWGQNPQRSWALGHSPLQFLLVGAEGSQMSLQLALVPWCSQPESTAQVL